MKSFKQYLIENINFSDLLTKLKKSKNKDETWYEFELSKPDAEDFVIKIILSLPKGDYKLNDDRYGTSIRDVIYKLYGNWPSMLVNQNMLLGLQAKYPNKVSASFTHDLDKITIK